MNAHVSTETDFYSSSDFQLRERVWVHVCVTRGEDNAVRDGRTKTTIARRSDDTSERESSEARP